MNIHKSILLTLILVSIFLMCGAASAATTVYVSSTGSDSTGDGSINNPYATINVAISHVNEGGIIHLLNGTYKQNGIIINKNITITGESATSTIISGQQRQIFTISNGCTVTITDLTLTNGSSTCGGAISNKGTLTLANNIFNNHNATYGGAIYNTGILNITNTTFTGNTATYGGVIHNNGIMNIYNNNIFNSNSATYGGAIKNYNEGKITVINTEFTENKGRYGGAIDNTGTINLKHALFRQNTAIISGGAIYNYYGTSTINNTQFNNNNAVTGGAIFDIIDKTTINNTQFNNNNAVDGGSIYNDRGKLTLTNNKLTQNTATSGGGALYNIDGDINMHFCSLVNNTAPAGCIIYSEHLGKVDASYNWWGSNNNPSTKVTGDVTTGPWLYMTQSNSRFDDTVKVTVSFNNAYDGNKISPLNPNDGHILDGTLVKFNQTKGTINPNTNQTKNGTTTTTYTGSNVGSINITATTDNEKLSQTIIFQMDNVYVSTTGSDSTGDGTPKNPYATINTALKYTNNNGIIHLQKGTYKQYNVAIDKNVTITGESAAETIINGQKNNVFTITNGSKVVINQLTITNASNTVGAIANRAGDLTITNDNFHDNTATNGGAIFNELGNLTIKNTTFSQNTADNAGGAIFNSVGNLTITQTTFNKNTATNGGGAVFSSLKANIHYSSFINNTAATGNSIWSYETNSVNASYNWWGSNNNPSNQVSGDVTTGPWLYMTISNDTTLEQEQSTNVTVSFNNAYDGKTITTIDPQKGHIIDCTLVNLTSTMGTINQTQTTINGIIVIKYTAKRVGNDTINATTDYQTLTQNIIINNITANIISTISGPKSAKVNKEFSITSTITNNGPDNANNTTITIQLPKYYTLTKTPTGWTYNKNTQTLTQNINILNKNTNIKVTLTGKITQKGTYQIYNTITTNTHNTQKNTPLKIKIQ